jgi:hypothetical protein
MRELTDFTFHGADTQLRTAGSGTKKGKAGAVRRRHRTGTFQDQTIRTGGDMSQDDPADTLILRRIKDRVCKQKGFGSGQVGSAGDLFARHKILK